MKRKNLWMFGLTAWLLYPLAASASQAESGVPVWLDDALAVSYYARVEGDWLVVEAVHEPGWHTYSMDNVRRARERSGKAHPETELPTSITPLDGLTIDGAWRQSAPLDLSTPDIRWYTWGFEGRSYFAVRVDEATLPTSVQIDAQACTDALCAMVDALEVPVASSETTGEASVDPESLVIVESDVEPEDCARE